MADTTSTSSRRDFLKTSMAAAAAASVGPTMAANGFLVVDDFDRPDSLYHGIGWESQNPGYWEIRDGALHRRLKNVGDRARKTGFPYHYETHRIGDGVMPTDYDPSLPTGMLWRRDQKAEGAFSVKIEGLYLADRPAGVQREGDAADWAMYQDGFGQVGIAFGGKSLFEGFQKTSRACVASWHDDHSIRFEIARDKQKSSKEPVSFPRVKPGETFTMTLQVVPTEGQSEVRFTLATDAGTFSSAIRLARARTEGYVGIATRGLVDFSITSFAIDQAAESLSVGHTDCYTCYPLGDTLDEVDGQWQVKFVSIFASDGETAELRVADSETPAGGWENVPVSGAAKIVNHEWRRNTAIITAALPAHPAEVTHFYTIWKDGKNVTSDLRIGTAGSGPGTGLVGDVPGTADYVGRLPQLQAPYRLAGLSCHAITSGLQQRDEKGQFRMLGGSDEWQFRDQPTVGAYQHLEDYDFQVMVWEDDVWYMELVLYPPSTDDAFKVVTTSICGPTSRWQMMRHWNVINPGDHDYGMDDIKGPEQLILRNKEGLGQDIDYLRRNFQIVHHLVTGEEEVDGSINPKKWRAWKMPNRDFTLGICDARLWRSSQDTDIWVRQGWGEERSLYDRTDPTRTLLGEEQFAWLQELIRSDTSSQICLTGLNGLHTIWTGANWKGSDSPFKSEKNFHQRDRVTADYAGWVKAGADRVIQLLAERDGVVTVYGDVHNGCIMKNTAHRLIECSFGPIGRSGGRGVIPGFGPEMVDVDDRALTVAALYHKEYAGPDLQGHAKGAPFYWNFLEMVFDPSQVEPTIELRVRNLVDAPTEAPRGGGALVETNADTGRPINGKLPMISTLPNADVRFVHAESGKPIRGTRSRADGTLSVKGFPGIPAGEVVLMTVFDGTDGDARSVTLG